MDECVLWGGTLDKYGYGITSRNGKTYFAHRAEWIAHFGGPLSSSQCVLHACDTPACINVNHLFLGTRADNCRDRAAKGRSRRSGGSVPLTEAQLMALSMPRPARKPYDFRERTEVDPDTGCMLWTGQKDAYGHPVRKTTNGKVRVAREAYLSTGREIPAGYSVFRVCRVKLCVNPEHLEAAPRVNALRTHVVP